MNTDNELDKSFEELQTLSLKTDTRVYGTGLWKMCHRLAEAGYQPAKKFFIKELDDPRWDWRRVSVELLGYHYKLGPDVVDKFRNLLSNDPDSGVRIAAAYSLGKHSQFPEKALTEALTSSSDEILKEAAFSALLEQAGIPYTTKLRELDRIRSNEIEPSMDHVKRIISEENLTEILSLLENPDN